MAEGQISLDINVATEVQELKDLVAGAVKTAQRVVAEALLIDSLSYVPVLTGALRDSGRVEDIPAFGDSLSFVRVVYGSSDINYAIRQHEEEYNHPSLGFKGRAKYLTRPFQQNIDFYMALFELTLRGLLESDEPNQAISALGLGAALSV